MAKLAEEIRKFPCAQCGADVEYFPGVGLRCPFCGHDRGEPKSPDQVIEEIDFSAYLVKLKERAPEAPGAAPASRDVKCGGCSATSAVPADALGLSCPFCGAPMVVETKPHEDVIPTEGVVPFAITKEDVAGRFKRWVSGLWFAPSALKRLASQEGVQGLYRPFYTFDASTTSFYEGQRGEHYYETEHFTDSQGKRQTRQVRKTRWYAASGDVSHFFDDVVASAGRGLDWNTSYDLKGLKPYDPGFLAGWVAERASVTPDKSWPLAKEVMDRVIDGLVRQHIGGDEQRVTWIKTAFNGVRFKYVLLPLHLASYAYGGKTYRFQCNGQTGEVHGERPYSAVKIALFILACLAAAGALVALLAQAS